MQVCRFNRGVPEQTSPLPSGSLFGLPQASASSYVHLPMVRGEAMTSQDLTGGLPQPSAEQFAPHTGLPMASLQAVVGLTLLWNYYKNMIMKLRLEKCVKRRNVDTVVITQKKSESSQRELNP